LNFSLCLVCGKVQGRWPVKGADRYFREFAKPKYWEAIVCFELPTRFEKPRNEWASLFFRSKTIEAVEYRMELMAAQKSYHVARWFVRPLRDGDTVPKDFEVIE